MHKSKKGFTIVELVIVIAVIAILAAVLIPTFSNLVKKANQSADIQAARQMNTVLAAEGAVEIPDIFELYDALAANGMTAKDYKPLTTDHYFFWDDGANRIVYTDKNYQVLFPTDFEKQGNWISLNAKIPTSKPATFSASAATVKSAEELAYVVEEIKNGKTAETFKITINGELDMKGANLMLHTGNGEFFDSVTISGGTIKNVTTIDHTRIDTLGGDGHDGLYAISGVFGNVKSGTVTVENTTFENIHVRNTHVSGAGILFSGVYNEGNVVINNVTIKNSTVIAHRNVGALVGYASDAKAGTIVLKGTITLDNVQVQTVGGRSGLLFGYLDPAAINQNELTKIELKNGSDYTIYECEQNTGTFEGQKLGLDKTTNILHSYAWSSDADGNPDNGKQPGNALENKRFFEGAYATEEVADNGTNGKQAEYKGLNNKIEGK